MEHILVYVVFRYELSYNQKRKEN